MPVPAQDNFDWQDVRRDLLPGVLGQFEMLGKTIYTHILQHHEYAARVHDPYTYDVVSRDLVQRWAFPLVPDGNLLPGTSYRCSGHNVYQEAGVQLARSAHLTEDCVIGSGSSIGERTTVEASVIGRGCTIGSGVTLAGCYLWSGVTVEDGASLTGCICCDNVFIGRGASARAPHSARPPTAINHTHPAARPLPVPRATACPALATAGTERMPFY